MKITNSGLIRATGLAAIAAGAIFAGIQPIHPADELASVTTGFWAVIIGLKFAMCLFFLVGLAGIYARQAEKAGWLGFAGFALLIVSWFLQTGYVFVELFVLPVVAAPLPGFVDSALGIANGHPGTMDIGAFMPIYGALGACYLLGGLLFGIATVRAAVLPRWPAIMLALAAVITPAAALLPHAFQRYAAVPMGIAMIWLGYSLWVERRREKATVSTAALATTVPGLSHAAVSMPKPKSRRRLLWLMPIAVVVVASAGLAAMILPPPADLDLGLSKTTEKGLYIGTLEPDLSPVVVGKIHSWTIVITSPDGTPVEYAKISIDGGMPQHGHGLPTVPQVTGELGGGHYTVEGMKFNMPGWWIIKLDVDGSAGADTATFNLIL